MSEPTVPVETGNAPGPVVAPLDRLTAAAEVFVCSGVPTQLAIQGVLAGAGWALNPGQPELSVFLTLIVADTVLVIALMVLLLRAHGERARALWLGSRSVLREGLVGLALVPPVFFIVVVLLNVIRLAAPWLHNVPVNPFEALADTSPVNAAVFAVAAVLGGGVKEELQRAFLLHRFEQYLGGPVIGVVVLSIAFGLGHWNQGWDAVITTAVLGAFWAVVYLRRRSSVAPIVSHAGFNALEIIRGAVLGP